MENPSNADLFNVLLDIKGDIGGLKATTDLQLTALTNHSARIGALETSAATAHGAAKIKSALWGGASAALVSLVGAVLPYWLKHRG
jgi:hypothetical protein